MNQKSFYRRLIDIAWPITLQNFISNSLNAVDTIMIGSLGAVSIASVGLANQVFFVMVLILFGTNSGASIFVSQFWGKKDLKNIRRVLGLSIIIGGTISILFSIFAIFAPNLILSIYSKDPAVIRAGSEYIRIVAFSYLMTAITFSFSFALRSIGQAKRPLYISVFALLINTGLNYILIFGHLGFDAMGVKGAAIATLTSRTIEMVFMVGSIYYSGNELAAKFSELLDLNKVFVVKVLKTSFPVIVNEAFWALGMTIYMMVYGRISTDAVAAMQIAGVVTQLFMVFSFGLGNASAVMLGNALGANEIEEAKEEGRRFIILSVVVGLLIGALVASLSGFVVSLYNVTDVVKGYAQSVLYIYAVFMFFKVYNTLLIIGLFRGGGDTTFSMYLEVGSVYGVGVPMALLGAFVFKFDIVAVVLLIQVEEVVKSIVGSFRIKSGKWAKNVVDEIA